MLNDQIQSIRARMRDIEARKPDGWSREIEHLQEILGALALIATLRRRLAIQLRQSETAGAFPPAYLELEIQDARDQIRAQKDRAANLGVIVEAESQDDAPENTLPSASSAAADKLAQIVTLLGELRALLGGQQ